MQNFLYLYSLNKQVIMENAQIKLSETVMMVDVAYLNFVINDLKKHFEPLLGRPLQTVDLALLTMYLAMDAGVQGSGNDVQVLLVYDGQCGKLEHCLPSDLKTELDGVAFKADLGEFSFMSVPSEGFVSRGDLYVDLLQIVLNAAEVKKLIIVPFAEEYGKEVEEVVGETVAESAGRKENAKDIVCFRMTAPAAQAAYRWEQLGYPLMSALGIRSEDLQRN